MLEGGPGFPMGVIVLCDVGFKDGTRILSRDSRKHQRLPSLPIEKEVTTTDQQLKYFK